MHESEKLLKRIEELEIQAAFQEDLLQNLSDCLARVQHTMDIQQAQLRWLYQRLPDKSADADNNTPYNSADEIPPHY